MSSTFYRRTRVSMGRHGVWRRRDFLRGVSTAAMAAGALSWSDVMALESARLRQRGKACILLWMQGGPSPFETFSPKPGHENGGETEAINTNVPGIQIADRFPEVAQVMDRLAIIRSMNSKEGNHQRASFLLHTGYAPTASVKHPTFGAIAANEIGDAACELPAFVRIGRRIPNAGGGGLLGAEYDPFVLDRATEPPANTALTTDDARFRRRLGLLDRLEEQADDERIRQQVADHQKLYQQTAKMITSRDMQAFDLSREPENVRQQYGEGEFAAGCLLARRLVESGVTFVEVGSTGWDTHADNFPRTKELAGQVDQPYAALIRDLERRGMLDSTLVVWMGEFGRTPRINPRGGRDHYPRAFNVVLGGCGIRGGQVVGATDESGADVAERPVTVHDLFQTFCTSLDIDSSIENMSPIGRPIRIVEDGEPVSELFS